MAYDHNPIDRSDIHESEAEPCEFCEETGECPECHGEDDDCELCWGTFLCPDCEGDGVV